MSKIGNIGSKAILPARSNSPLLIGNNTPIFERLGAWTSNGTATLTKADLGVLNFNLDNLPASLTFNGLTVEPTFRYYGGDATTTIWTPWGYGETLVKEGTDTPVPNQPVPIYGSKNKCIQTGTNSNLRYQGSNTLGNTGTNEVILEALVKTPPSWEDINWLYSKYQTSGNIRLEWDVRNGGGHLTVANGATTNYLGAPYAFDLDTWYYFVLFLKLNQYLGFIWNVNGVHGVARSVTVNASLDNTGYMGIGERDGGAYRAIHSMALLSLYQAPSWSNGITAGTNLNAAIAEVAASRYASLLKPANLVQVISATTGADLGLYRVISMGINSLTLDRPLSGSDSDVYINAYKDVISIQATDNTNGQIITAYSDQDKPTQISGDELEDPANSLDSEDFYLRANVEHSGIVYADTIETTDSSINNEYIKYDTLTASGIVDVNFSEGMVIPSGVRGRVEARALGLTESAGEVGYFHVEGTFFNSGGGTTQVGTTISKATLKSNPNWIVDFNIDGSTIYPFANSNGDVVQWTMLLKYFAA